MLHQPDQNPNSNQTDSQIQSEKNLHHQPQQVLDPTTTTNHQNTIKTAISSSSHASQTPESSTDDKLIKAESSKKKRSPNWLAQEEEQLASSWLKVSEQPEFHANQTSEAFYKAVEADFNQSSKLHHRDQDQIRIRWAALNTATLKFSAIYNAIEKEPPDNTSPKDWMVIARKIYSEQSRGHAFKDEIAWQILRHAPKWKQDYKKLNFHHYAVPELSLELESQQQQQQQQHRQYRLPTQQRQVHPQLEHQGLSRQPTEGSSTSIALRSPGAVSSLMPTIEERSSKRSRIDQELEHLISQSERDSIESSIPVISSELLDINHSIYRENRTGQQDPNQRNILPVSGSDESADLDHLNRLTRENLELESESKRSQIEMNNLKLLMQSEKDCPDEDSVMMLRLMKARLKKRLLAQLD